VDWIDDLSVAWRREYPDLDVSPLPPMVRMARMAYLIEQFQAGVLEPFELTSGDYGVLATLRRAGRPYELSPGGLTSRLRRSTGGMTKILKRLEDRALIARVPDPDDGRSLRVKLTRRGLALQERVFNAFLAASGDVLRPLDTAEREQADTALRSIVGALERWFGEDGEVGR